MKWLTQFLWLFILLIPARPVDATTTELHDKQQWQQLVGDFQTIDFTGFPKNTHITNQYAYLGAFFTDGLDVIDFNSGYLNDGVGLYGAIDSITVDFTAPCYSIATEYPGMVQFELYYQGQLTFLSSIWVPPSSPGSFTGLVSTTPFDKARIFDPGGGVFIDDLFFGPPIPAPPGIALALLGLVATSTRKRRTS